MATSIAVTGRRIFVTGTTYELLRVTPVYNNPLQFNIVYNIPNGSIAVGLKLFNINGDATNTNYAGTGLSAITLGTTSLLSTITVIQGYTSGGSTAGSPISISIQDISPTLDFIAVTAEFNVFAPRILRLPPVTAHKRPIFIKLGRNAGSGEGDGVWIITRGDSFIEFATRDTEVVGGTTYNHSGAVFIGGQSANGTAVNYPCITLFSDGSNWYVANYYPMSTSEDGNQYLLRGRALPPLGDNRAFTDVNFNSGAYVFDTNVYNVTRSSSHNVMTLRTPSVSSICIVAYGGSGSPRLKTNSLIIHDIRSTSYIDGFSPNHPYIHIDADNGGGNAKNSGIVLFYDATGSGKWYVIGWFYPAFWTFSNLTAAVGDINGYHSIKDVVTPAGEERKICVVPDIAAARFYTLPLETATNPQVIIFKAKDIGSSGDNSGIRYSTLRVIGFGPAPTFTPIIDSRDDNRINTDTISIQYGSGGATNARSKYSCVWFISQKKSGEDFLRYYPVVGYVPNP